MPAQRRSLAVTETYRARLFAIRERAEREAARRFPPIERLDTTDFPQRMAAVLTALQAEAVRASGGYLSAYVSSEFGRRTRTVTPSSRDYAGLSRDGRDLREALRSPLIGTLAKLKEGAEPEEAVEYGRNRAVRMVEVDLMHAARMSLLDAIEADPHVEGWQRAVYGTCGPCMAFAGGSGPQFRVHPNCRCVSQPVVSGVRDRYPLPTGEQLLERMSRAEMVAQFGEEKADKLAAGSVALTDLVGRVRQETAEDFISEKPAEAL